MAAESLWRGSINDTTLLASRLSESLSLLNRLSSANQPVSQARDNARLAVQATRSLLANQASAQEIAVQLTSLRERLGDLAQAMRNNGDNLTLNAIQPRLAGQASLLPANGAIPPPGTLRTLAAQADDLAYLATLLASHANALAYASRGPADKIDAGNPESLHALAENALLSLEGSTGTLARLQQAMTNPGGVRQKAADEALAASQAAVATLLAAEQGLPAGTFAGGTATTSALIWQGAACAFLQTGSDTPSWWFANSWEQLVFLQISGPDATGSGRLHINDLGHWPFVVIAAGGRLGQQIRPGPAVADYLEDLNADAGRDGDASAPPERFRQSPISPQFNDQLAY